MLTQSAKAKGRDLENFVAQLLRDSGLDQRASRNPGSGSGKQKGDIWNALGLTIECKNTKKAPGKQEFEQVRREALGYGIETIIWHPPQVSLDESKVIINIHDWIELLKKSKQSIAIGDRPNKQIKLKLEFAKRAIHELIKELEHEA